MVSCSTGRRARRVVLAVVQVRLRRSLQHHGRSGWWWRRRRRRRQFVRLRIKSRRVRHFHLMGLSLRNSDRDTYLLATTTTSQRRCCSISWLAPRFVSLACSFMMTSLSYPAVREVAVKFYTVEYTVHACTCSTVAFHKLLQYTQRTSPNRLKKG